MSRSDKRSKSIPRNTKAFIQSKVVQLFEAYIKTLPTNVKASIKWRSIEQTWKGILQRAAEKNPQNSFDYASETQVNKLVLATTKRLLVDKGVPVDDSKLAYLLPRLPVEREDENKGDTSSSGVNWEFASFVLELIGLITSAGGGVTISTAVVLTVQPQITIQPVFNMNMIFAPLVMFALLVVVAIIARFVFRAGCLPALFFGLVMTALPIICLALTGYSVITLLLPNFNPQDADQVTTVMLFVGIAVIVTLVLSSIWNNAIYTLRNNPWLSVTMFVAAIALGVCLWLIANLVDLAFIRGAVPGFNPYFPQHIQLLVASIILVIGIIGWLRIAITGRILYFLGTLRRYYMRGFGFAFAGLIVVTVLNFLGIL
jgi:hypothetical protein